MLYTLYIDEKHLELSLSANYLIEKIDISDY